MSTINTRQPISSSYIHELQKDLNRSRFVQVEGHGRCEVGSVVWVTPFEKEKVQAVVMPTGDLKIIG
jgi:hypothetical protein